MKLRPRLLRQQSSGPSCRRHYGISSRTPTPRKARGLRQPGTIEPIEQADFLRMPRPKLLQPWREDIESSASGCQIVQVLDHLEGRIIVGLPFGGDECFDMLP